MMVNADLAKLVDNDRYTTAVLRRQDAVEQGRLSRAEKSGEYGHRHSGIGCPTHLVVPEIGHRVKRSNEVRRSQGDATRPPRCVKFWPGAS